MSRRGRGSRGILRNGNDDRIQNTESRKTDGEPVLGSPWSFLNSDSGIFAVRTYHTASDSDVKFQSRTRRLGTTRPASTLSARPSSSILFSMNSGLSFQRKFLSGRVILPFSIRKVPSRVSPVTITVR